MDAPVFDLAIVRAVNACAGHSRELDAFVVTLAFNDLLKGGIAMATWTGLWFGSRDDERGETRRARLLALLAGAVVALALNRAIATLLPFRVRPINDPALGLNTPFGVEPGSTFSNLSAFPSDHAVMFFGIAAGLFAVSRRASLALAIHACIVVVWVRLYLGLHWFTDLGIGATLGAGVVVLFTHTSLRERIAQPLLTWRATHPASFYTTLFVALFEFGSLFHHVVGLGYLGLLWLGHSGVL